MANNLFPFATGPAGRDIVVDASGFLVANGNTPVSGLVYGFGNAGREIVVDASGRLLLSSLSVGLGGGSTTASNLGSGSGVFAQKSGDDLQFKSLVPGANITITGTSTELTIATGSGVGEANTASNVGTGAGVFKQKTGVDLEFKSLAEGSGIQITGGTDEITIDSHGLTDGQNVGTGSGVYKQKSGTIGQFKSLLSGTNIGINDDGNTLEIFSTGGGGGGTVDGTGTAGTLTKWQDSDTLTDSIITEPSGNAEVAGAVNTPVVETAISGTSTIDLSQSNIFRCPLQGSGSTVQFTNPLDGGKWSLHIEQNDNANGTIDTWPTTFKWRGGTAPTITQASGAIDVISFQYDATRDHFLGDVSQNFS